MTIFEPGLAAMVKENLESGRLHFTYDEKLAVEHGEVLFIAVGTPSDEDGSADLKYVLSVGDAVSRHRVEPVILVEKSTVPVGTGDTLRAHIEKTCTLPVATWSSISSPTRNFSRKARPLPTAVARTASSSAANAKKCVK